MTDAYTENLADFRIREIELLQELLTAWLKQGLPADFDHTNVRAAFNRNSGYVFLVNEYNEVAMMNDGKLESFYTLAYGAGEGFLADLLAENDPKHLHEVDINYLLFLAEAAGIDLSPPWAGCERKEINTLESNG